MKLSLVVALIIVLAGCATNEQYESKNPFYNNPEYYGLEIQEIPNEYWILVGAVNE